jgi:lipopolysaccharide assembly outer membrane protein LptD (OstA)
MEPARQSPITLWIQASAIIIAVTTAIAYFWTLFYEVGFYSYFYIPFYFISLSPVNVLVIGGRASFSLVILCILLILFTGMY